MNVTVTPRRVRLLQLAVLAAALVIGGVLIVLPWWWVGRRLHGGVDLEPAPHAYSPDEPAACPPGSRPGPAGKSRSERTADGVGYIVATPANYDATRAHPLIVVFSPHGANRFLTERFSGLTHGATEAGFVIVHVDSHSIDPRHLPELGRIPAEVAERWCIDPARVFFTGHSDGGTVSVALAVLGHAKPAPAAIAPSAAGFRREDLEGYACPAPLSVMVLQNRDDEFVPGFGREAVEWWARCNGCGLPTPRADGCVVYGGCRDGVTTAFCESEGTHLEWPDRNRSILGFFAASRPSRN